MNRILINFVLALLLVCALNYGAHPDRLSLRNLVLSAPDLPDLSPTAMAASPDGRQLYLACATANEVVVYDVAQREITRRVDVPASPSGLTLSRDGRWLYATCAAPKSRVCVIDSGTGKIRATLRAGHTAMAPVLSPDGGLLYICDRFNDSVEVFDLSTDRSVARIPVDREPVAAAISPDGNLLFVANHLHSGRADQGVVAATLSVIDTRNRRLLKNIPLTNGSSLLQGVCVSPDGKYVALTHTLARFHLPTTTVQHGWMNNNALSLIETGDLKLLATVLLDEDNRGAANPWAVEWSADGKLIGVSHAGTHELSLIDAPRLLQKILSLPALRDPSSRPDPLSNRAQARADIPNDLGFLAGLRTRIMLHGNGPRCLAMAENKVFVAHYFSDSLSVVEQNLQSHASATIHLESPLYTPPARKGEMYFNDARIAYQGWQSCASCHSSDGRVDGMNWDLLNDGIGNPKNVKSLLFSFETPPVMAMGVRSNAAAAVRAGIHHILFSSPPSEVALAIDQYIKSLQSVPSPHLFHNRLSAAAERGRRLFLSRRIGCAVCHTPPLFTDLKMHAVGTGKFDQRTDQFYTPPLVELWRTAPYLHDGSAATLQELLLRHNPGPAPGQAANLQPDEIDDLVAFLLSV